MSEVSLTRFVRCRKCKCWKPRTSDFFHREAANPDGMRRECKKCTNLRTRDWQKRNPERAKESTERWRNNNLGYRRQYQLAYNRDPDSAKSLAEKRQQRLQRRALNERKRQARQKRNGGSHHLGIIAQMYHDQGGLCAYCEIPLFEAFHVDHMIPLFRDGSNGWENLAIACPECNCSKQKKTAEEFCEWLRMTQPG